MNKKNIFLQTLVFAFLCIVSFSEEKQKPNVVFIIVDDLNDWIGVMGGHPQTKTPNLDALAEDGVLFTNAHCNALQWALVNKTPSSASASRFGVLVCGCPPITPIQSLRSSTIIKTTLGFCFSSEKDTMHKKANTRV